jgi:hypothetical protein
MNTTPTTYRAAIDPDGAWPAASPFVSGRQLSHNGEDLARRYAGDALP